MVTTPVGVTSALVGASLKPTTFSPNGDGRYETTTVTYTLQAPAALQVRVLDASGAPVRTLFSGSPSAGTGTATWDGRVGSRIAAPGAYTIAVAATTAAGMFELRSPVVLDLRGVTITQPVAATVYSYPDGYRDTTLLRFRLSGRATVTVFVYRAGSSTPIRTLRAGVLPAGNAAVAWDGRDSSGRRVAAGSYRFRVQARDPAAIVRLSAYGTVAVSGKRLVHRTVTVTVTGDAYLSQSYRWDEAHAFIEPSPAYPNGVRARVESGTGAGGPAVTLYYRVTLPTAVTAESLTATVDYVRTGVAPRVRVRLPGVTRSPEMLLEPLGGPLTVVLPSAILIDLVPGPAPPTATVEVTLDGTGTLDLASFQVTYAYAVLQ
jgi:flagellar hook assembly protein FlgD